MPTWLIVLSGLIATWGVIVGVAEYRHWRSIEKRRRERSGMDNATFLARLPISPDLDADEALALRALIAKAGRLDVDQVQPGDTLEQLGYNPVGEDEIDELVKLLANAGHLVERSVLGTDRTVTDVVRDCCGRGPIARIQ